MDQQLIKTLIDTLQASGLTELEYSRNGETLRLSKGASRPGTQAANAAEPPMGPATPAAAASASAPGQPAAGSPAPSPDAGSVTAPLYGVVHLGPAPGAPPFVAVGQAVDVGTVLCTVEAMKVFTQVRAVRGGTVDAILVTDGQEVEPGQILLRLA